MINCAYCSIEVTDTLPNCPHCGEHLTWYAARCEGAGGNQKDVIKGTCGDESEEGCGLLLCLFGWMLSDDDNEEGKCGSVFWTSQAPQTNENCATCGNVMKWYVLEQAEHVSATPGETVQNGAMERETVAESDCGCGPLCCLAECCLEVFVEVILFPFE